MKTVMVTGGAGFLGSYLCEKLLAEGSRVICVDNFYTGNRANIDHLKNNPNFTVKSHDIIRPLVLDETCDAIYNLACPASPVHYQAKPIETIKCGAFGVFNMADLALKNNALLLHASTSEVYGDPEVSPQPETYHGYVNPFGIRSCYDESKRLAESILFEYIRQFQLPVKIVRIFNTYGPRMQPNDGRVVSNFIIQALKGENITVYGDGLQTRSFCYVDDLIEVILRMANSDRSFTGPVNIGNPTELTVKELAERIIRLTGSASKIIYLPLPQDDPLQRNPDITLAKTKLQWEPKVDLETGLQKTIKYFKQILA